LALTFNMTKLLRAATPQILQA